MMDTLNILQHIWFFMIVILFAGYSILDGFDLGIGIMFKIFARNKQEKLALINSIGPLWDGNEVWLLTAGGALFASFPDAYATVFSGFYLALMLVLFALIFRAVSIEFYVNNEKKKNLWEGVFIVGSFIPSLFFGVALGNVMLGIPLDVSKEFTGNFFTLFRPFPLAVGLLGLNAILLQAAVFAIRNHKGQIKERAGRLYPKLWSSFVVIFLISVILTFIYLPDTIAKVVVWIFIPLVMVCWFLLGRFINLNKTSGAFFFSSMMIAALWGLAAAVHFPNLVKANDPSLSITISNSSSQLSLTVMFVIAVIGMPLVLFYTYYLYKIFFKRNKT
jgi:cytochrome d ubiquinol oxidase subunit II